MRDELSCDLCGGHESLICSNCVAHLLLRYRVQQMDNDYNSTKYTKQINSILENCINQNSYGYTKTLTANLGSQEGEVKTMTAKLAQQLLSIEIVQLKKSLLAHKDKIDHLALRNTLLKAKIDESRARNSALKTNVGDMKKQASRSFEKRKTELLNENKRYTNDNKQLAKYLSSLRLKLAQEVIDLSGFVKRDIFYIGFTPLVSLNHYINYSFELINANLSNISIFVKLMANVYLTELPFTILTPNEGLVTKLNSMQKYFKFVAFQPILRSRNECYPLYLTKNLAELNKYELSMFVKLLGCLILDIVSVIQAKKAVLVELSISQFANLGDLIWMLVNDPKSAEPKDSFLKTFLQLQKYKPFVNKVDLNLKIDPIFDLETLEPPKSVNDNFSRLDFLSIALFKLLGADIQRYRSENEPKLSKLSLPGGSDYWEVV